MSLTSIFFFAGIAIAVAVIAYIIYFRKEPTSIITRHPSLKGPVEPIKPTKKKGEAAPVTGICGMCGEQVTMPFKCKYCKGLYCSEHRLPEGHNCDSM